MTVLDPLGHYRAHLSDDLCAFAEASLEVTDPIGFARFVPNWHQQVLAYHLERVERGECRRLLILAPPRSLKSHMASVAFPAWVLGRNPARRILCASHSLDLAKKLAGDSAAVMRSSLYCDVFPGVQIDRDRDVELTTRQRGSRYATSIGGPAIGRGADIWILDDLHKPEEIYSDDLRERPYRWLTETAITRLDDKATGSLVLIMQRLHPDDIASKLIATGDWEVVELPAIAGVDTTYQLGPSRTHLFRAGEYLQPAREGRDVLDEIRRGMGTLSFNAQYLQAPQDMSGGVVQIGWIHRYDGVIEPRPTDYVLQSWDPAISDDMTADYSVCTTWVRRGGVAHLVDVWRDRRTLPELIPVALDLARRWSTDEVVIETNGIGLGFYQSLLERVRTQSGDRAHRRTLDRGEGLVARTGRGDHWRLPEVQFRRQTNTLGKLERLIACTPQMEDGRVKFPTNAHWLAAYMRELLRFNGRTGEDDQVDSTSQALQRLRPRRNGGVLQITAY
ncbi:hypothetical protein [Brevundimonas subvibrioides]|uniref:phage terminase large subunit family protein n=1 Tax=Brevundimonas subvibrioides TaxID=74313 RepID=UPI0022B3595D|nr:hypothetical protein [Brevundimonas subvibrioides]